MRLTKRQLKRIIREEYSRLKRRGLIKETDDMELEDEEEMSDEEMNMRADYGLDEPRRPRRAPDFHIHESRRRRNLRRIVRESFRDMRHSSQMQRSAQDMENKEMMCIDECFDAVPAMMKRMCGMGMSHMVTNDIYHICEPICKKWGCDCDHVSRIVEDMCCKGR